MDKELLKALVSNLSTAVYLLNKMIEQPDLKFPELVVERDTEPQNEICKYIEPEFIIKFMQSQYNFDITQKSRLSEVVKARNITVHLIKTLTPISLKELGRLFGGKDHTTILHSLKYVKEKSHDKRFAKLVEDTKMKIVDLYNRETKGNVVPILQEAS